MSAELDNSGEEMQAAAAPETDEMTQESVQERSVPLPALESERAKRQQLEEENRMMKEHFALLQAQQKSIPSQRQEDDYDGMDDSDVMTVGEFKKLSSKITNQFNMTVEELKMTQKHPDYQEVISQYLPEVINNNPSLKSSLQKSQDYELAYYLAKNSDGYKSQNKRVKRNADADRIIKNSESTGSLSSMGASTPVGQAKKYKDLSDADFSKLMHKNLGY